MLNLLIEYRIINRPRIFFRANSKKYYGAKITSYGPYFSWKGNLSLVIRFIDTNVDEQFPMSSGFRCKHFNEVLLIVFMISQNFIEKYLQHIYIIHILTHTHNTNKLRIFIFFYNFRSLAVINAISLDQADRAQL